MKTPVFTIAASIVLVCLATVASANDVLPLPQSVGDLKPVIHQEALPAASNINVGIPTSRLAPDVERDKTVLRLAPGQSKTIALATDAASVIVANPTNASVFLDNSRLLVIVPRAPGATGFTVLDRNGKEILNQQIVVDNADDATYVRVTRICGAATVGSLSNNCIPSSVYFCPDNCVPVTVPLADAGTTSPTIPPVASMPSLPPVPNMNTTTPASPPNVTGSQMAVPAAPGVGIN